MRQHARVHGCYQADVAVGTSDDRDQHGLQECGAEGDPDWLHPLKTSQQWGTLVERGEPSNWALKLRQVSARPWRVAVTWTYDQGGESHAAACTSAAAAAVAVVAFVAAAKWLRGSVPNSQTASGEKRQTVVETASTCLGLAEAAAAADGAAGESDPAALENAWSVDGG